MPDRPRLKICGLTTLRDLRLARDCGADYLGLVVEAPGSPRSLTVPVAASLARAAQGRAVVVAVSRDPEWLAAVAQQLHPRALQLHGEPSAELMAAIRPHCPVWVAIGLPPAGEAAAVTVDSVTPRLQLAAQAGAEMIVLDTSLQGRSGGTGQVSDWSLAAEVVAASPLPVLLAGGLGPDNIVAAWRQVRPAGLDLSSRLEATPGRKDPRRLTALAEALEAERQRRD